MLNFVFRPNESLGQSGFWHQKGTSDFGRRESAQRSECECDLGLVIQGWMTAGEY